MATLLVPISLVIILVPLQKKAVLCPFNRIHSRGRSRLISRNTPEQRASAIFSGSPSLALAWKTLSENSLFPLATVERTVCLASIPRGRDPVGLPTPLSAVLTVGAFGPVVCRRPRSVRFVTRPHAEDDVLKVTGSWLLWNNRFIKRGFAHILVEGKRHTEGRIQFTLNLAVRTHPLPHPGPELAKCGHRVTAPWNGLPKGFRRYADLTTICEDMWPWLVGWLDAFIGIHQSVII